MTTPVVKSCQALLLPVCQACLGSATRAWFDADDTFHADDVPAGEYEFNVSLEIPGQAEERRALRPVDFLLVFVPGFSGSKTDEPTNLGTVELQERCVEWAHDDATSLLCNGRLRSLQRPAA